MMARYFKNIFEYIIAVVLFVLIAPLMGGIALCIKLLSRGPLLVKLAINDTHYRLETYKFRTFTTTDPKRPIPVMGRYLRATGLDQLPRIISVLRGEMALLGSCRQLEGASDAPARPAMHFKPGLLCTWLCGRPCKEVTLEACRRLNNDYIVNGSIRYDIKILLLLLKQTLKMGKKWGSPADSV